jgi:hypothetical protein
MIFILCVIILLPSYQLKQITAWSGFSTYSSQFIKNLIYNLVSIYFLIILPGNGSYLEPSPYFSRSIFQKFHIFNRFSFVRAVGWHHFICPVNHEFFFILYLHHLQPKPTLRIVRVPMMKFDRKSVLPGLQQEIHLKIKFFNLLFHNMVYLQECVL